MILRALAVTGLLAAAVFLALLAHDAWHWQRALQDADARAAVQPISADAWSADTVLPSRFTRRFLGVDTDLAFRRAALQGIVSAQHVPNSANQRPRALVEAALGRVERNTSRPVEAAIAADELGVLAYADPPSPSLAQNPYLDPSQGPAAGQLSPTDRAQEQFTLAATLDPSNDNALRNLEIVLRAPISNPKSDTTHTGAGDQFGHKGSGSRPAGRGY